MSKSEPSLPVSPSKEFLAKPKAIVKPGSRRLGYIGLAMHGLFAGAFFYNYATTSNAGSNVLLGMLRYSDSDQVNPWVVVLFVGVVAAFCVGLYTSISVAIYGKLLGVTS